LRCGRGVKARTASAAALRALRLPEAALTITRAARTRDTAQAIEASDRLSGLWELFETYGSLRVVATAAAQLGLTQQVNLPRPLRRLDGAGRERLEQTLTTLALPR
jgi:4-hydroxy-tetrahydrodipicolinate synthase